VRAWADPYCCSDNTSQDKFAPFADKMQAAGLSAAAIAAFKHNFDQLVSGVTGLVRMLSALSPAEFISYAEAPPETASTAPPSCSADPRPPSLRSCPCCSNFAAVSAVAT